MIYILLTLFLIFIICRNSDQLEKISNQQLKDYKDGYDRTMELIKQGVDPNDILRECNYLGNNYYTKGIKDGAKASIKFRTKIKK